MICTHVLSKGGLGFRSPLDLNRSPLPFPLGHTPHHDDTEP